MQENKGLTAWQRMQRVSTIEGSAILTDLGDALRFGGKGACRYGPSPRAGTRVTSVDKRDHASDDDHFDIFPEVLTG